MCSRPRHQYSLWYDGDKQARCYPAEMREDLLKRFFVGDEAIDRLAEDVSDAAIRIDPVHSTIQITDMEGMFTLTRGHIMLLCDATLSKTLTADALTTIAFALLASDHFKWSDDVISEVLQDWSCPEINFPLVDSVLKMHRDWLTGAASPPKRPSIGSGKSTGHIVSEKRKVRH
jgi:hypothetical protein